MTEKRQTEIFEEWIERYQALIFKAVRAYAFSPHDHDDLFQEIGKLDEVDRSLTLLILDGFSYREMSKILGISESHVGVKIHRIKKHLITQSENYDRHEI